MPGYFSRIKNWVAKEVLSYSDLNAEFNNIISNCQANKLGGYSVDVPQMQSQVNPGGVGSESRADTIAEELERLRFVIARMTGKTYWYETPAKSLAQGNYDLSWYFPCIGNSTLDVVNNFATRGCKGLTRAAAFTSNGDIDGLNCFLDADPASITTANTVAYSGGKTKTYSLTSTGFVAVEAGSSNANQGTLHIMFRNLSPGDYLFHNNQLGIEVYLDGSGYLNVRVTERTANTETTKQVRLLTGTVGVSGNTNFRQLIVSYNFNGINGVGTDSISFTIKDLSNAVINSGSLTNQTISTYTNRFSGGTWYIGARSQSPTWTGYSAMSVLPSAETAPWTATLSAGSAAVNDGVLTFTHTAAATAAYNKTTFAPISGAAIYEWKTNLQSDNGFAGNSNNANEFRLTLQDNLLSRAFYIVQSKIGITVQAVSGGSILYVIPYKFSGSNIVRVTISGAANPVANFYVNGAFVGSYIMTTVNAGANSATFTLRTAPRSSGTSTSIDLEYFAYATATAANVPVALNTSGNVDEAALFKSSTLDSAFLTSLNANPIIDITNDKILGLNPIALISPQFGTAGGSAASVTSKLAMILGDGKTDISIVGASAFSVNTIVAGVSYRSVQLIYGHGSSSNDSFTHRYGDISTNYYGTNTAFLNSKSVPGINMASIETVSSNITYTVSTMTWSNGISVSTGIQR